MAPQTSARLPALTVWIYGLPALALTSVGVPLLLYLVPYYTEDQKIPAEAVGLVLLCVRLADALFDPTTGFLSDRTRSRWGRRRPWMAAGTVLMVVAVFHVFMPQGQVSWLYFLFWMVVLYASWTIVIVPYAAWGAELTADFSERTRVAGIREVFLLIGTILAASVPTVLSLMGLKGYDNILTGIGVFVMVGLPLSVALLFWKVPEPPPAIDSHHHDWRTGFAAIRKNGPFLRLIAAFLLNATAQAMVATLFFFYARYQLAAADLAPYMLLTYFITGIAAVPFWLKVAERFGKHRTWAGSMLWSAVVFLVAPFLGPGDAWIFWIIVALTGACLGCDQILAASMQADVVDIDSLRSGQHRAGLYFAIWNMVTKLASGIAAGVALPVLGLFGFSADLDPLPGPALWALLILFCLVPPVLRLASVWIIWGYPITKERHAKLIAAIARKKARLEAAEAAAAAKA